MSLLSIVVVYFEIPDQFENTLHSMLPPYQLGIDATDVEVIIMNNGSRDDPEIGLYTEAGYNVRIIRVSSPEISPSKAINIGLNASIGRYVGVFIDGARILSPGLLSRSIMALRVHDRAIVGTRGRYLGPKYQRDSMLEGYDRRTEIALIENAKWRKNGYNLFDCSVFDESSGENWFEPVNETNTLFASRKVWQDLGGYSEQFKTPGGGYVNLDTWCRACSLLDALPIILIGEASFHQIHGGVATNGTQEAIEEMHREYVKIRGHNFETPSRDLTFFGGLSEVHTSSKHFVSKTHSAVDRNHVQSSGVWRGLSSIAKRVRSRR